MTERKKILLILLPILLLALSLRLIGIENPIFEREPSAWRQIHTNVTIQGYLHHGFKFFYPEANFMGDPGYFAQEFPLYQYLVALLYKLLGENVIWGRLFTIIASLGALTYLFIILRKYFGVVAAAVGALGFAIAPLSVYYGRTVMMDSMVLFLSLGFTWHFLSYLEESRWHSLALAVILSTLAVLIKITIALVFLGPLLLLPLLLKKGEIYKRWGFYLLFILPLIAAYLWKNYAEDLNLKYNTATIAYSLQSAWLSVFGPWKMRIDPFFYQVLFMRITYQILTWIGIFLAGGGIVLSLFQKKLRPLLLYLLSAILYCMTFTSLIFIHDYYQLPLIPIYVAFMGVFTAYMTEKIKDYTIRKKLLGPRVAESILAPVVVILVGIMILVPSIKEVRGYSKMVNYSLINMGKQIEKLLPPQALVIAVTMDEKALADYPEVGVANGQPKLLYAMGHHGWNLNYSYFTLSKVELLKQEGARFLVMDLAFLYPQDQIWRGMIVQSLRKNYQEIYSSPRLLVYDLNKLSS